MSVHTQNFIIERVAAGLTLDQAFDCLTQELGISVKRYPADNLVLLDYCQLTSPKTHPVVIECRSLILSLNMAKVISTKFDRFFNIGEAPDYYKDFDFSRSIVYNKEDGSLIGIYHNPHTNRWEISTRGTAMAEGPHPLGGTFRDAVITALGLSSEGMFQHKMSELESINNFSAKEHTFVMEYCSHRNLIVTPYSEDKMFLLEVSNTQCNKSGKSSFSIKALTDWVEVFVKKGMAVTPAKVWEFNNKQITVKSLIDSVNELTGMAEGFVVYDPVCGKRVKIKNSTYIIAHQLRGNNPLPTRKNMLGLLFNGNAEEFVSYFPVWSDMIKSLEHEVREFIVELNRLYDNNRHIVDQKEFALAIKNSPGQQYLFKARKYNMTPTEAFLGSELTTKQKTFGV